MVGGGFAIGNVQDRVIFSISSPGTTTAFGSIVSDCWYHFAGTYDGFEIRIYINNWLSETVQAAGSFPLTPEALILGFAQNEHTQFSVDDLFIYSIELNSDEITQLYER
ncbi:MAG: LamG domain-containing protein [Bacteroidetes bacterium]|nr:LamG domain-containing protein [Bacteroidota bacterium]